MNHGTATAYLDHACRCEPCKRWNYLRTKKYRLITGAGEDGRPLRPLTTDAQPIGDHVDALVASGWTKSQIADELGHTVYWLYSVTRQKRSATGRKRIRRDIAAAILALEPLEPVDVDDVTVDRLVDGKDWRSIGATMAERRAAAERLHRRGVPHAEIQRRLALRPRRDFARWDEEAS